MQRDNGQKVQSKISYKSQIPAGYKSVNFGKQKVYLSDNEIDIILGYL